LSAIRYQCDRKILPSNAPAVSWREERLLRQIATDWCRHDVIPNLVKMWSAAGTAPAKTFGAPQPSPATPRARPTGTRTGDAAAAALRPTSPRRPCRIALGLSGMTALASELALRTRN